MATTEDKPQRSGIPAESENFRHTGARKLEARPGESANLPSDFGESPAEADRRSSHLSEPVNETQDKTHTADGRDPPGSFGTEADPQSDAWESDPSSASAGQARRPL